MSSFIQCQLSMLNLDDPFLVSNSEALVAYLREENAGSCELVSFDVEDMFYSNFQGKLMKEIGERFQLSASVAFF